MSKTAEATKKEFTLNEVLALWKKKSKDGKKSYFTGSLAEGKGYLTAFYNTKKQNPKEPDIRIYQRDGEGNLSEKPICSLWCNVTKNGKKILSGKLDGKRVVGFINAKADEKRPYITVYWSEDQEAKKETKTEEKTNFEEVGDQEDLPF